MSQHIAEIKIQLSTLLSNVCLPNYLPNMFWTGLTKLTRAKFLVQQKRPCAALLQAPETQQ